MKTKQIRKFVYTFYSNKPAQEMKVGDTLKTKKGNQAKITDCFKFGDRLVFCTDKFGLVFENEIEAGQ